MLRSDFSSKTDHSDFIFSFRKSMGDSLTFTQNWVFVVHLYYIPTKMEECESEYYKPATICGNESERRKKLPVMQTKNNKLSQFTAMAVKVCMGKSELAQNR